MLLDDKLYFVSAEAVKLDVQIRDFHSGSLLKEFSARRDESIPFMNTPIVQDESLYHAKSPKPQTTAELLYRMTDGSAKLIAIPEDSGRVGLTIGSWKELTKSRPSGPPLGPGGMMTVNVYTITQETRFRMLVDPTTLQHAPGPLTTDIWDRVGQYNRTMSIPPKGFCLFVNGGRWAYTYYNRDKHSIELALF